VLNLLSLIVPIYNGRENIVTLLDRVRAARERCNRSRRPDATPSL